MGGLIHVSWQHQPASGELTDHVSAVSVCWTGQHSLSSTWKEAQLFPASSPAPKAVLLIPAWAVSGKINQWLFLCHICPLLSGLLESDPTAGELLIKLHSTTNLFMKILALPEVSFRTSEWKQSSREENKAAYKHTHVMPKICNTWIYTNLPSTVSPEWRGTVMTPLSSFYFLVKTTKKFAGRTDVYTWDDFIVT